MEQAKKNALFSAILNQGILKSGNGTRLVSPSGSPNRWLIDLRSIAMNAATLDLMADLFWETCEAKLPFQIGGMEVAAVPLIAAILVKSVQRGTPINGFVVRKERKTYGTGKLIEGQLTADPIVLVDDIFNTGTSLEKTRVVLDTEERKISYVFAYIDYQNEKGLAWQERHAIPVIAPFVLKDFDLTLSKPKTPAVPDIFHKIWRFVSPDPNFFDRVPKSFPVTDGASIYFGSDCGIFWCLDATNGSVRWKFKVNTKGHKNIWSAPAIDDGRIFFGGYDGNVYCLDCASGAEIWRFTGADWVGSSPALAPDRNLLFIGLEHAVEGQRGSIVALDLRTGVKRWEYITKRYTHASPAYWAEKNLVACGSNDNEMLLFDAANGALKWRFETKGDAAKGSIRHAPAFDKKRNQLITGCADGWIYVIDNETGNEVWSVKTDNTIYTIPLVVEDLAFIGSTDKHLYVLDLASKTLKNKVFAGSKIFGPAQLLEGKVYFGACNGLIYELSPTTGQVTGTHQLPDAITNRMTYSPDTKLFYALTYVNQLYALKHI